MSVAETVTGLVPDPGWTLQGTSFDTAQNADAPREVAVGHVKAIGIDGSGENGARRSDRLDRPEIHRGRV